MASTGAESGPAWSPDGKRIAFSRTNGGTGYDTGADIFVVDADGSGETQLTSSPSQGLVPSWSPDGSRLVWEVRDKNYPGGCGQNPATATIQTFELWVMNADGSGKRQLTPSGDPCESTPDWSPDGKRILYVEWSTTQDGDDQNVAAVGADGTGHAVLINSAGRFSPDHPVWSPDGASVAFFSVAYYGKSPNGLFIVPVAGGQPTRILPYGYGALGWGPAQAPVVKPKAKKPPLCKKGQRSTKKKPCRKRK